MAVGDTHVFPGFLTPVLTQTSFQSHRLLFSHASEVMRGENTPERKFASTGDRNHNHQVTSPTRSPLSHPDGALRYRSWDPSDFTVNTCQRGVILSTVTSSILSHMIIRFEPATPGLLAPPCYRVSYRTWG